MGDFEYTYKKGMRVGLAARLLDVHDTGNYVMQIEGTSLHIQLSEKELLEGADLVCAELRRKADLAAAEAMVAEEERAVNEAEAAEAARKAEDERLNAPKSTPQQKVREAGEDA